MKKNFYCSLPLSLSCLLSYRILTKMWSAFRRMLFLADLLFHKLLVRLYFHFLWWRVPLYRQLIFPGASGSFLACVSITSFADTFTQFPDNYFVVPTFSSPLYRSPSSDWFLGQGTILYLTKSVGHNYGSVTVHTRTYTYTHSLSGTHTHIRHLKGIYI